MLIVPVLLRTSRYFRAFVVGGAVGAIVCVPNRASADAGRLTLRWSGPEGCSSEDAARRRIAELAAPGASLDADVVVTEVEGRFRAAVHVQIGSSVGERLVEERSCERLVESTAVLLAMSATPLAASPPSPPAPPPTPSVDSPIAPPRAEAPSNRPPIVRIRAHVSVDVGTLPTPTAGGGLAASYTPNDHVAIGLAGGLWAQGSATSTVLPTQGASLSLLTLDATACYGFHAGAFELSPCAVLELASIVATGVHTDHNASQTATWPAVGAGAAARWEMTRHLALVVELEGLVPILPQSFVISRQSGGSAAETTFYAIGPVAGRGYFGPEVRF